MLRLEIWRVRNGGYIIVDAGPREHGGLVTPYGAYSTLAEAVEAIRAHYQEIEDAEDQKSVDDAKGK